MQKSAKSRILGVNITVYHFCACTLSTAEVQIFQQKSLDTLHMLTQQRAHHAHHPCSSPMLTQQESPTQHMLPAGVPTQPCSPPAGVPYPAMLPCHAHPTCSPPMLAAISPSRAHLAHLTPSHAHHPAACHPAGVPYPAMLTTHAHPAMLITHSHNPISQNLKPATETPL